ncbi:MAG: hypothetical protein ACOCXG_05000 [Nanoarchaeota archaeon]
MKKIYILICIVFSTSIINSCLSEEENKARQEQQLALKLAEKEREEQRLVEIAKQKAVQDSLEAVRIALERQENC